MGKEQAKQAETTALNIAPICLFAYKRPGHLKRAIDALGNNALASQSDVIIYSDGPKTINDEPTVEEVRGICHSVSGFRSVNVVERKTNFGLSRSVIDGVTATCKAYGRVIVVEDDLVVSPFFLDYMNDALDVYEHDESVFSAHGYLFPISAKLPETFFLLGADCWGWATWSRAWKQFEADGAKLLSELSRLNLMQRMDFNGAYNYSGMLQQQVGGRNDSWAIRWQASVLLRNGLTLYPRHSLVRNIGFDDSGTHSLATNEFDVELAGEPIRVERIALNEDKSALAAFEAYYRSIRPTFLKRLMRRLRRMMS